MFDEKADETLVRAERRAMNAERRLVDVVAVAINEIEPARLCEIDLVGRDGEFAADHAPDLHVDLRSVERRFVRHFHVIDSGTLEHIARHVLGLFPKLRFIDKFLPELRRIVRRETHQIFLEPEELEVIQIHLVHGIELGLELLRRQ